MLPLIFGAANGYASLAAVGFLFFMGVSRQIEANVEELELEADEGAVELAVPAEDPPGRIMPAE